MFAVLQVEAFALQAVLRLEPTGAGQPVALIAGEQRSMVVVACNAPAQTEGVSLGQTAPQALARCPKLLIRPVNAAAEAEARAGLLAVALGVSPSVEATSPGLCTLQVEGLAEAQREPALRKAVEQLSQLGLHATAGLGATPLLALYAARRTESLLVVRHGKTFLAPLPLSAADPTPELSHILTGWGIHTLGDLTKLSKADVTHRLGPSGLALWERAAGEASRPLHLIVPTTTFTAQFECEFVLETLEPLLFVLRRLVDRLALELSVASMAARDLKLTLALENETTYAHTIHLPEPTTQAEIIFRTLFSHLESVRTETSIVGVSLTIEPVRIAVRQQGLFDCALRDPHGFAETLARAAAIVGADRVGTPRLENTHRADAFVLETPASTLNLPVEKFRHGALGLGLRRYRPVEAATVEITEGQPAYLWTQHLRGFVRKAAGPWQGSGHWWEKDKSWEREEWDVELEEGGCYRLMRTLDGWFLEGEYD